MSTKVIYCKVITEIVASHRPQDVVIFIVGGTTYEEARSVALYNAANPGVRFFLGGSVVLNSKRYQLCTYAFFAIHMIIWSWTCSGILEMETFLLLHGFYQMLIYCRFIEDLGEAQRISKSSTII